MAVCDQPDANGTTKVSNPESYTIQFYEGATFTGKADRNQISGTYSTEGGYSITLGPTALAFCGERSLDTTYLGLLNNVAAGGPDGAVACRWKRPEDNSA